MQVRPRRALALAVVSLVVAASASVAALYRHEPRIGLDTDGAPIDGRVQELYLRPGTVAPEPTATTAPPTTVPTTMVTTTVRPSKPGEWPATLDTPEERGCIPGTWDPRWSECQLRPVTVTGVVRDTYGRPVPGICLYAMPSALPQFEVGRTGADGRYTSGFAPTADSKLHVAACPDVPHPLGWVPTKAWLDRLLRPGDSATLDVTVTEAGGVHGRVVDDEGDPVHGVCVASTTVHETVSAATDAEGRFVLPGVVPGDRTMGLRIGTDACPSVGIWDAMPTVHVEPGRWSATTLVMTAWADHAGPPFEPQ